MSIGTLREQQLHAGLKQWLAQPGDTFEQKVDGYYIDIVRDDLLIEVQTGSFLKLKNKLNKLLANHRVLLVHPVAATKWIVRKTKRGRKLTRRKSPKRGRIEDIFSELLYIPEIAVHPNFQLRVLLVEQEDIWKDDGRGSWRRKHWSVSDKVLVDVVGGAEFRRLDDYLALIPGNLKVPFTHRQLAEALKAPIWVSTRMSYCLRKMGALEIQGKNGRSMLLAPTIATDKIVTV
jgi:hypothetical protein